MGKLLITCNIPKSVCSARKNNKCILGIQCKKIIDKCIGCKRIENDYCKLYVIPEIKWRLGDCPSATHIQKQTSLSEKRRVGQQKQKRKLI